ncbi:MAG: hypothetical protein IKJ37_12370 [Kiritimatiellae bacterium]|nr:hypothetical protein [Kiritimatiellia bacterium]
MKVLKVVCLVGAAAFALSSFGEESSWRRPRTTRRYLHPPLAQNMFTLWNDGKIIRGDVAHHHDWSDKYPNLKSDVIWVMHGEKDEPFDFKTAENRIPEDGMPFHGLTWRKDGLVISLDAFCDTGVRLPTCFIRLTVENDGAAKTGLPMAVMFRRLRECYAVKGSPDIYEPYETSADYFRRSEPLEFRSTIFPDTWKSSSATIRAARLPEGVEWDGKTASLRFIALPPPGRPLVLDLTFGAHDGVARPQDWETAKTAAAGFWRSELAKINRLPAAVRNDPAKMRLVKNLTVQMLQCFSHPVGSDLILPRQGGLQRFVWPWDCKDMLIALGLIGDFDMYIEGVLDFYFREYSAEDGRIGPFKNDWVCNSGECLYSLSRYCRRFDKRAVWNRHRDAAFRAFDWICQKRKEAANDPKKGMPGFFPTARATDNKTPIQLWVFTDHSTLAALKSFALAARHFGDSRADEVQAEYEDLRGLIASVYKKFSDAAKDKDEFRIPIVPSGDDEAFIKAGYFNNAQGYVLRLGLECGYVPQSDVMKVYNWHLRSGKASPKGLCANHPSKKNLKDKHIWYTTNAEQHWYWCFRHIGRDDLADLVFDATVKYSVSDEYYVGERYRDDNPWYFPWSPNASGSGRIIRMLLNDSQF